MAKTKIKTLASDDEVAFSCEIVRESEKAVMARVFNLGSGHTDVWFPKSQIKLGTRHIFCKFWLAAAKMRDTGANICTMEPALAHKIEAELASSDA